jgi:serine/threonine-protein kinase
MPALRAPTESVLPRLDCATIRPRTMHCPACNTPVEQTQRFCPNCGADLSASQGSGTPGPDPMIGQTLGSKYRVVRLLGEGGMGAVYEGEQQLGTTKRKVAIKTLHPHLSRDPKIKARFEREVGTIAELEHPNTIQVYDFGSTPEGILYIVMEFLQGRSLADLLEKEGALTPERALNILEQVCGSLEEAHGRGIVHRDLKPDNVVLVERAGKKDFVKVLDFGIAKRSNEEDRNEQKLTQQGMVLGTPPYMSPEQFTGQPIDARSDIYSLGVMAYEMLSGRLPFRANTAWEWATQHMTASPIPIESMAEGMRAPEGMRSAIRRALAKTPNERFQTMREFGSAFASAAPAAAAASSPGAGARARTEMGAPLDVAAAFGAGPGGGGATAMPPGAQPPQGYGPPAYGAQGYTPVGGNVAFPTPAGIPQPPPRDGSRGGGGGRTVLLASAGLIGIASVVAIVFAMRGAGHGSGAVLFDAGDLPSVSPATTLTAEPSSVASAAAPPLDSAGIPGLNAGGGGGAPRPQPHPQPSHEPSSSPTAPSAAPTTTAPAPKKYDGPECQTARRFKAIGRLKEAQSYVLACIAKGGDPN